MPKLLPALSDNLPKGAIKGVLCRGRISVDNLQWDLSQKQVSVTMTSRKDRTISLMLRRGIKEVVADSGEKIEPENTITTKVELKRLTPMTLTITLM